MFMKKVLFFCGILFCFSCTRTMDIPAACKLSEDALKLIDERDYVKLAELYSADFNASEEPSTRMDKFNKILDATGTMLSFKCLDTANAVPDEFGVLVLNFDVEFEKVNATATFDIIEDVGGLRINRISIQQK